MRKQNNPTISRITSKNRNNPIISDDNQKMQDKELTTNPNSESVENQEEKTADLTSAEQLDTKIEQPNNEETSIGEVSESTETASTEAMPSDEKNDEATEQSVATGESDDAVQTNPDIKARLPYFATVVNKEGEKIGKVRRYICYDSDKQRMGKFVRQENGVFLVEEGERQGYLDKNDNLFSTDNNYVATIKRSKVWLLLLIFLLIGALAVVSSLFAAFYTPQSKNYFPTLFIANEDGTSWDEQADLPVFFNKNFGDNKICPGLSGKYTFLLENRNKDEILFDLTFSCENEYNINLVYRLKRDGAYIAGYDDYVPLEELNLKELTQQARSTSVFELEWMWQHNDSVDTIAGENSDKAVYKLFIQFLAEVNLKK